MVGPAVEMINLFYNSNEALKSACAAQWSVNWMVGAFIVAGESLNDSPRK